MKVSPVLSEQLNGIQKNRPQGDAYRNDQLTKKDKKKFVQSRIKYKDTGYVLRERNDSGKNHYIINDGEPLRALRTDVPQEVKDITQMKDVNIQGQHPTEQYFLLADKPGQVAKKFNEVAGLTIMDKAMSDINSQVRSCNTEISVAKKEIDIREKELKESEWVIKAEKFAKKLKKIDTSLNKKLEELSAISNILINISKVDTKLLTYDKLDEAKKVLKSLLNEKQQINDKVSQQNVIKNTLNALLSADLNLKSVTDTEDALNTLKELKTEKQSIELKSKQLRTITGELNYLDYNDKSLKIAENEYKEAKKQYDIIRINFECPTCGRKGKSMISHNELTRQLDYNYDTGLFIWKVSHIMSRTKIGDIAGYKNPQGYITIGINQKIYLAHILAWFYVHKYWPRMIDHKNQIKHHNYISNLRKTTNTDNQINRGNPKNNNSGVKGRYKSKRNGIWDNRWKSYLKSNGKSIGLGSYLDFDDAVCARLAAEQCLEWDKLNFSPAHRYVKENIQGIKI